MWMESELLLFTFRQKISQPKLNYNWLDELVVLSTHIIVPKYDSILFFSLMIQKVTIFYKYAQLNLR